MGDLTDEERRSLRARYEAAAHAMQSGAAIMLDGGSTQATPKHLRVGVNTAMADQGSLARLLIAKGLITEREYYVAIAEGIRDSVATLLSVHDAGVSPNEAMRTLILTQYFDTLRAIGAQSRASTGEAQYQTPRPSNFARFSISGRR